MAGVGVDLRAQALCLKQKVRDYERITKHKDELIKLLKAQVHEQQKELLQLRSMVPAPVHYSQFSPYMMPPLRPPGLGLPSSISPPPESQQAPVVAPQEVVPENAEDNHMDATGRPPVQASPMEVDCEPPAPSAPSNHPSENGAGYPEGHDAEETEAGSALMALAQGNREDQTASTEGDQGNLVPPEEPKLKDIDGIPIPPMSGRLGTVQSIWEEWTIGWYPQSDPMHLNPSIQELNRLHGESWRRTRIKGVLTKYQKNEYGRKKKVAHEVMTRMKSLMENGLEEAEAVKQAITEVEDACKASKLPFTRWIDTLNKSKDVPDDLS